MKEIHMAEQKVDPSRPKNDQPLGGTTYQPTATPPAVDASGTPLPLGTPTLEAQRAGFKAAEQAASGVPAENPMQVTGVEADVQTALQNPEQSGPAGTEKSDVQATAKESKAELAQQAKQVTGQEKPKESKTAKQAKKAAQDEGKAVAKQEEPKK